MKTILLSAFLLLCTAISLKAQEVSKTEAQEKLPENYDEKLAQKLGADDYGMKNYLLVILKTGPKDSEIKDPKVRGELFKGHFSNMQKMQESGKLKLAGPFSTLNKLGYRGIFLLDMDNEEEAKSLLSGDPTIKEGIFEVEILPWYGSAAIETHLEQHSKIAKKNP